MQVVSIYASKFRPFIRTTVKVHNQNVWCAPFSTWRIAANGLQQKWIAMKQRTVWRYRKLKDKNAVIVFSTDQQQEKEVLFNLSTKTENDTMAFDRVLQRVSASTLNGILRFMLYGSTADVRLRILNVLTRERLDEITVSNRAIIVHAIQSCLISSFLTEKSKIQLRKAVIQILLGTYEKDLSVLKELIHTNPDAVALMQPSTACGSVRIQNTPLWKSPYSKFALERMKNWLQTLQNVTKASRERRKRRRYNLKVPTVSHYYGDLTDLIYNTSNVTEIVRIMQHIATEAAKVAQSRPNLIKVISDIDDTLIAGWLEQRYPLNTMYPGVSQLFTKISHGLSSFDEHGPCVTFLTARPRGWLNVGRYLTVQHLNNLGLPSPTVMNGTVQGLISNKKIALHKFENFKRFATIFPEFKFVFFGDSGQGDALAASLMLEQYSDQVIAAFVHDINPQESKTGDGQSKRIHEESGIVFYKNYVAAALGAFNKKLITADDLKYIADKSMEELAALDFVKLSDQKELRQHELLEEVSLVEKLIS
ncbi:unnamed protein product [Albugo candida]|uniref:Phosphatidate phosphatase APP1 catalytic domain-containing protein n=1 Tax=Albugo candida TaxID=65357 RepID=A0A024GAF2_9STRA|nr:unnamed protein product [Albugo candida]|eukprot:CCI43302.1 unnamed protein product [Albugo candida]